MHSAVPPCHSATLQMSAPVDECTSAPVRQHGWAGTIVTGAGKVRETTLAANPGSWSPLVLAILGPWSSGDIPGHQGTSLAAAIGHQLCHQPCSLVHLYPEHQAVPVDEALPVPVPSVSASTSAPALLSALPPALLTSASASRAPGHQYRCQRREWQRGPKAGEGRGRICSTLVSPIRPGPDRGAAIKGIPPMMGGSPAVEVRVDPGITIYTATGVAILVFVNLSL